MRVVDALPHRGNGRVRAILLNPGPVSLSPGVRKAAAATDLCHREPEFFALQDRVRSKLTGIYDLDSARWLTVTLGGSGTTALEAMVSTLLPRNSRLLVVENGVYGERLSRIASIHGIEHESLRHGWSDAWDMGRIDRALAGSRFTHVAAVHHETTTGRLNPVDDLARRCESAGASLLLDAVSSFGAEAIPFGSPALAACGGTANKCLHGIPGLCFIVLRRDQLARSANPPRTLTLDLAMWAGHQEGSSTPFTPSVNGLLALDQALDEMAAAGGWKSRQSRYRYLADQVAAQLARHGIERLLPRQESSCVLHAYRLPGGTAYDQVHDGLKQRGFIVYGGQGALSGGMFRISTMGDITDYDLKRLLTACDEIFG